MISVIVPVYKAELYIQRCVDSILNQTYADFELILVNDGSPDSSGAICDEYEKKDERIHVIHQENAGVSAARNVAIDWAFENSTSEWITFIDSDDWVHPRYLELLLKAVNESGSLISMCRYVECGYEVQTFPEASDIWLRMSPGEAYIIGTEEWGVSAYPWGRLYYKPLLRSIRYPEVSCWEDLRTTYKLLFACEQIAVLNANLYYYYINQNGLVRSVEGNNQINYIEAYKENLLFFQKRHDSMMELRIARALHDIYVEQLCSSQSFNSLNIKLLRDFRCLLIRYGRALQITLKSNYISYYLAFEKIFKLYENIPLLRTTYRFLRDIFR